MKSIGVIVTAIFSLAGLSLALYGYYIEDVCKEVMGGIWFIAFKIDFNEKVEGELWQRQRKSK